MNLISILSNSAQHGTSHRLFHNAGVALKSAWSAYLKRRLHLHACTQLHAMSDRELRDIGLSRSEIEVAVRGPDTAAPHHLRSRHY